MDSEDSAAEAPRSELQERWERAPWFVYFLAAGEPPIAVKIGVTTQAAFLGRFQTLQGANHEPLRLLGVIPFDDGERPTHTAERKEQELHRRFARLRRFQSGCVGSEWFTVSRELMEFVAQHVVPPRARGLPETLAHLGPGLGKVSEAAREEESP